LRTFLNINIANPLLYKQLLLNWAQQHREVIFLDNNVEYNANQKFSSYDYVLAVDAFTSIKTDYHNAFEDLKQYQQTTKDWIFGYLSYDLKNDTENLKSENFDGLEFADLYFFQPKKLFLLKGNNLEIKYLNMCDDEIEHDLLSIEAANFLTSKNQFQSLDFEIKQRISKEKYIEKVSKMLWHIQQGDIYEANFCMEFYAENAVINPLERYEMLNKISKTPFSVFFKNHKNYLLSASPERYLRKEGETIISQPIKGTAKRFLDKTADEKSKIDLQNDPKERSENVMIVDLVRNDLSKTAQKNTVKVTELCQVYSFLQVHQMISTIASKLHEDFTAIDVLKTTFPMGSMTGAPKLSAMNIIEELEETKRGLYSGAVGYFTPDGDFDFNVVIRSILYNQDHKYLSFSVGSAITNLAVPESEYDECLLKANAMFKILK
jgi:para-aminobenzoate synthetase component 1